MRHFICIGPNAWAKGYSEEEAVRGMRKNVPSWIPRPYQYETFEVHPDTEVDLISGGLIHPQGHPPISLGIRNPKHKTTFRRKVRVTEAEQKRIDAMVEAATANKRKSERELARKEKAKLRSRR